jgi:hypothetical protein
MTASGPCVRVCTAAPTGVDTSPAGSSFYTSFADAANFSTYAIQIQPNGGAISLEGDLNSTYFGAFYSITNALAHASQNGNCPFELVLTGYFPQGRYFSMNTCWAPILTPLGRPGVTPTRTLHAWRAVLWPERWP